MKLLTNPIREKLLRNGRIREQRAIEGEEDIDFIPVAKLFTPDAGCTWLLTDLDPEDPDIAFGLCDLGLGYPELGTVRISELESVSGRLGLSVERDMHFAPVHTLKVYARAAWNVSAITERKDALDTAAAAIATEVA